MTMLPDDLLGRPFKWDVAKDLLGETFEVFPEDGAPVALQVVEVLPGQRGPFTQFSLTFRGPHSPFLSQRTYRFRHARLGEFAFLISAVQRTHDATDYQACFAHEA